MNCIDYMNDKTLKEFSSVSLSGYIICFHAKHNIFQQKNWTPHELVALKYKKSCVVRDETNTFLFVGRGRVTAILLAVTFPKTEEI